MRQQGMQPSIEKPPDIDIEDKYNTNAVFCSTVDPISTKAGNIYSELYGPFPNRSKKGNI